MTQLLLINDNGIVVKRYKNLSQKSLRAALLYMKRRGKDYQLSYNGRVLPLDRDNIPFKRLYQLTGSCNPGYWVTITDQWEELYLYAARIVGELL